MPLYVLCDVTVASFNVILSGLICVDGRSNVALDRGGVDFQQKSVVFWVTTRTLGLTAFFRKPNPTLSGRLFSRVFS